MNSFSLVALTTERWFFEARVIFRTMNDLSTQGSFSQQMFLFARFFFIRPLFFRRYQQLFIHRPQILQCVGFSLLSSQSNGSDLSYCHQTVSSICDESKWLASDGSVTGFWGKIAVEGGLRQTLLRWPPASRQKRQRWHVFLYEEKCLGTVTPRSYSTFLC